MSKYPILATTLLFACVASGNDPLKLYQIGNSHTWDSMPRDGFPLLVEQAGRTLVNGWHIECGQSLAYITGNPEEVCVPPNEFGTWQTALVDHRWDAITLQTHTSGSGIEEFEAIRIIASTLPATQSTRVLLYVNWPRINGRSFKDGWSIAYGSEDQTVIQSFGYFAWLHKMMMDADLGNVSVDYVPIGAVLAELDLRLRSGKVAGLNSADDLYRDTLHMNNVGRYVASLTLLAVAYNYDVRQLGQPPAIYNEPIGNFHELDIDLANYIQEVVWRVVEQQRFAEENLPFDVKLLTDSSESELSFKTFLGYSYLVGESVDLTNWNPVGWTIGGDGRRHVIRGVVTTEDKFFKVLRF